MPHLYQQVLDDCSSEVWDSIRTTFRTSPILWLKFGALFSPLWLMDYSCISVLLLKVGISNILKSDRIGWRKHNYTIRLTYISDLTTGQAILDFWYLLAIRLIGKTCLLQDGGIIKFKNNDQHHILKRRRIDWYYFDPRTVRFIWRFSIWPCFKCRERM